MYVIIRLNRHLLSNLERAKSESAGFGVKLVECICRVYQPNITLAGPNKLTGIIWPQTPTGSCRVYARNVPSEVKKHRITY